MYGRSIQDARQAAHAFIQHLGGTGQSESLVGCIPWWPQGPSQTITRWWKAPSITSTSLAQLQWHSDWLKLAPHAKGSKGAQKVFVVLTDGHPDDPEGTVEECHRIRRTGGTHHYRWCGPPSTTRYLRSLCSTGNDYHHCDQSIDLEGTFINLATELATEHKPVMSNQKTKKESGAGVERFEALAEEVSTLKQSLTARVEQDAVQQKAFDQLYEELRSTKRTSSIRMKRPSAGSASVLRQHELVSIQSDRAK